MEMKNLKEENELHNIENIYSLNGKNKELWDSFLSDINNEDLTEKIIVFIKNKISEKQNIELALDIIDYIIDKGSNSIIDKIFQPDFFGLLINITIENNLENVKIEEKALFLMHKWVNKFNDKYNILIDYYNQYKNNGKSFPDTINTYDKYISNLENNNVDSKQLENLDNLKENTDNTPIANKDENSNQKENNNIDNNENFTPLENPFDDNNDNLLENVDFPDNEEYQNHFSSLRTSDIPNYFKCLRNKSIVENVSFSEITNQNVNDDSNNIDINNTDDYLDNNNEKDDNKIEENKLNDQKKNNNKSTNMNVIFNNMKNNDTNYTATFRNYRSNPTLFQEKWNNKISTLNKWIKEGKNSKNFENLKEGIRQLLIGLDEIEEIIATCAKIGDNTGRTNVSYIKSDMEQTCSRFECLIQDKKVEKFKSAFDGNVKKYYFNKEGLFEENNNINIKNIEDEKKEKKVNKIGRAIKNGFLKVGQKIGGKSKEKNKAKPKSKEREMKIINNIGLYNEDKD